MGWISDYILFLQERYTDILILLGEHLYIALFSVILGCLFAIPLGILLTKLKRGVVTSAAFTVANIFQTIPTIALLAIMIPFLGIGMKPAIFALFLYSLLPLLRNTYSGIKSVDPGVIESAKGMGLNAGQRLLQIELPLAFPYIMSGLRLTTVYIISWTTLAALIGAGGLGDLILSGIGINNQFLIYTGAVLAIGLALLTDFVLGRVQKKLSHVSQAHSETQA